MKAVPSDTLDQAFHSQCLRLPAEIAIESPGRQPLTYAALGALIRNVADALKASGIQRRDRVAIVLPNGPEMACATVGALTWAAASPLNPAYTELEFNRYLTALGARAMITIPVQNPAAVAAARALDIPVLPIVFNLAAPGGTFSICPVESRTVPPNRKPYPEDVALVICTSGTTAEPKLVPMSHLHLLLLMRGMIQDFELSENDRLLSVMPMFHGAGPIPHMITLALGGTVFSTPGFSTAEEFIQWMAAFRPTWFTIVPTMYQALREAAPKHMASLGELRLRFIRSGSAALPAALISELEEIFRCPLLEGYGMSEVAPHVATNRLSTAARKAGSVGMKAAPELKIVDELGDELGAGEIGEVVVRGVHVAPGFQHAVDAEGWFHTDDLGYLDTDGFLFLTGRAAEVINRGGQKVSAREIEEVLLRHPAVEQAMVFAIPHKTLGEGVGAAVILRESAETSEQLLRDYLVGSVAPFKVPQQILFVSELPKGTTGKLLRIGAAKRLGLDSNHKPEAGSSQSNLKASPVATTIMAIWKDLLRIDDVRPTSQFVASGGDSLLAAQLAMRIGHAFAIEAPLGPLLGAATVREQADLVISILAESRRNEIEALLEELERLPENDSDARGQAAEER